MLPASLHPDDRAEQLLALTSRLTDLLVAETRAFEARRPQDAAAYSAKTAELATLYRLETMRLRREPGLLSGLAAEPRRKLVAATQAFEKALAKHGRALAAARDVTEGLVRAIAAEVAASRAPAAGYGASARATTGDARAIALNARA